MTLRQAYRFESMREADDVIFFGPPLSESCDGHRLVGFDQVIPACDDFTRLLLGELQYRGVLVCICPNSTRLYHEIRAFRPDVNLRLIHYSHSTVTGNDEVTEPRLKYIELWFSNRLEDLWEVRKS